MEFRFTGGFKDVRPLRLQKGKIAHVEHGQSERHNSYAYLLKHVTDESSFGICSSHCISFDSFFDFVENFLLHGLVGKAGGQRSDGF